jgi:hypothetical protein
MLIEGDMISELDFYKLLDFHYTKKSSFTLVTEEIPPKPKDEKLKAFQENSSAERFTYILEAGTSRLIGAVDPWDLKQSGIKLKTSVLARHPNITFNSNLEQKGIVICNKGVARILAEFGEHFENFSEEFITFLAFNKYNSKLGKVFTAENESEQEDSIARYYRRATTNPKDLFRPFIYTTAEFTQRVRTVFDYHQVNLLRVPKSKEMAWMARTTNDDEDTPITVVSSQSAAGTDQPASESQAPLAQVPAEQTQAVQAPEATKTEGQPAKPAKENKEKQAPAQQQEKKPELVSESSEQKEGEEAKPKKEAGQKTKGKPQADAAQMQPQGEKAQKKKDGETPKAQGGEKAPQEPKQQQQPKKDAAPKAKK